MPSVSSWCFAANEEFDASDLDDYGQRSWLDVGDLTSFDWDQVLDWSVSVYPEYPEPGLEVTDEIRQSVIEYCQRNGWTPPGWSICGSETGFRIAIPRSCRSFAGQLLSVVDEMRVLAGDDPSSVRCVFGFSW